jgi:hypothetical protein
MKTKHLSFMSSLAMVCCLLLFAACSEEEMGKGNVEFEITDAPIDDAAVDAVMVTVADVKVNGTSVSGFTKQTINLKAYQEGNTKLLATAMQLDAKTYSNLTLVLDLDHDADGNEPGCYVRTTDQSKYKLRTNAAGTLNVALSKSWTVRSNTTTKIVLDFDLRKSIVHSDNVDIRYRFVSDDNLTAAIRIVAKDNAGTIKGTYEESESTNADQVIAYAYKKGTFSASTETQAQGEDNLLFAKAVASAKVKESLSGKVFTLALLEAGEYELHFASYNENDSGRMTFVASHQSQISVNGSLSNYVMLQGGVTTNISANITSAF